MLGVALFLTVLAALVFAFAPRLESIDAPRITNFEECAAAGNAVMESYPRQCRTPDGKHFVEDVSGPIQANECAVAGCSRQLCVSADEAENIMTTCEYRAEYACYKEAYCGPQADGKCGWSETAELRACLSNPPAL